MEETQSDTRLIKLPGEQYRSSSVKLFQAYSHHVHFLVYQGVHSMDAAEELISGLFTGQFSYLLSANLISQQIHRCKKRSRQLLDCHY